jgi:hypothetical protein
LYYCDAHIENKINRHIKLQVHIKNYFQNNNYIMESYNLNNLSYEQQKLLCTTDPIKFCNSLNNTVIISSSLIDDLVINDNIYVLNYLYINNYINKKQLTYTLSDALRNNSVNVSVWLVKNKLFLNSEANLVNAAKSKNKKLVKLMAKNKAPFPLICGGASYLIENDDFMKILLEVDEKFYTDEIHKYKKMINLSTVQNIQK